MAFVRHARLFALMVLVFWCVVNVYLMSMAPGEKRLSTTPRETPFRQLQIKNNNVVPNRVVLLDYSQQCQNLLPSSWPKLPHHGCRSNDVTQMVFCQAQDLRINPEKISCSRGGEDVQDVLGKRKDEKHEFPVYKEGALTIPRPLDVPPIKMNQAYFIDNVLKNAKVHANSQASCKVTRTDPTLFITRYEYANLYHTMTDFFNAFLSLGLVAPNNETTTADVVFLDGHAKGNLDVVWQELFGGQVTHVKHLAPDTCFSRAIFIPPGYSAPIWKRGRKTIEPCPAMMDAFERYVLSSLQLQDVSMQPGRVVIIERVPYISHPRSDLKDTKGKRIITNLGELRDLLVNVHGVSSVQMVRLEDYSVVEQIRLVRQAQVLIGNHGAGLSHLLFMHPGATVLEFADTAGNSIVFEEFAQWKTGVDRVLLSSVQQETMTRGAMKSVVQTVQRLLAEKETAVAR